MSDTVDRDRLAVDGGTKVRDEPFPQSTRFGDKEREYLDEALQQNTLFYHKGAITQRVCEQFCTFVEVCWLAGHGQVSCQEDKRVRQ